jgi:hypothetical protein
MMSLREWQDWVQESFSRLVSQQCQVLSGLRDVDTRVTVVRGECHENTSQVAAQIANASQRAIDELDGKVESKVQALLHENEQLRSVVQQLAQSVHELEAQGTKANTQAYQAVTDVVQQMSAEIESLKRSHALEMEARKTETEGLSAMVLSVQEHMLQLKPSSKAAASSPMPALQDFDGRIKQLERGQRQTNAQLDALARQLGSVQLTVADACSRLVTVESQATRVASADQKMEHADTQLAKVQVMIKELAAHVHRAETIAVRTQQQVAAMPAIQDQKLGAVVHKVQDALTALRNQMVSDRRDIAAATKQLKRDVGHVSTNLRVIHDAIHTPASSMSPSPNTSDPAVPVPPTQTPTVPSPNPQLISHASTPTHTPQPLSALVPHTSSHLTSPAVPGATQGSASQVFLPQEFRLRKNTAISSGLGLMGPVIVSTQPTVNTSLATMGHQTVSQVVASIAPVGAQPVPTPAVQVLPGTIAQALIGKEPGKFGGTAEDWCTWRMRWQSYVREVEELYPNITGRQKLSLLRYWLEEPTAELLDFEMSSQPGLLYEAYWAKLDLSFGAEDKEALRRRLRGTKLVNRGKVEEKAWRDFESKLLRLSRQLGDVSDVELGRLMVDALPVHPWRRKLAEEVEKKTQARRLVLTGVPPGMTLSQVETLIQLETGRRAADVQLSRDGYKVKAADDEHRNLIKMVFDRQILHSSAVLSVAPEVQELTASEINHFMLKWLRLEQRINVTSSTSSSQPEPQRHDQGRPRPRFHRKLDAEEEDTEVEEEAADATVQEVRAPRQKQATVTPPSKLTKEEPGQVANSSSTPSAPRPSTPTAAKPMEQMEQQLAEIRQELQLLKQGGKGSWNASGGWQDANRAAGWRDGWSSGKGGQQGGAWQGNRREDGGKGKGHAKGGKGHEGGKGNGGRGPPDAGTPGKGGQRGAHQQ